MKHYFLGMAAEYSDWVWLKHLMTFGRKRDCKRLSTTLSERYGGEAVLCKNGRSALALALKAYFRPGDAIAVNAFTCYAVYEAIKAARLKPVFVDISLGDLNFDVNVLAKTLSDYPQIRGIIVQNTLGNPVDIAKIERVAEKHNLIIIEDLAHCAGVRYPDGREAGTVGAASILSFGKDKSIDTISGGAVIFRSEIPSTSKIRDSFPSKAPRLSDHLRAKFYPMFGVLCRKLTYIKLGGALMRFLVAIHWVEKSADNRLDTSRRLSKFEAKRALKQIERLKRTGMPTLREFCFVKNRAEVLAKLQKQGYYFGSFWYEKPVSPVRYYNKVNFPEEKCPNSVYAAEHILNIPTYYTKKDLSGAHKIIKNYLEEDKRG